MMKAKIAHALRVVADELHALGVVAHGVQDAAQRRAGEGKHGSGADKAIHGDQVVHLNGPKVMRPRTSAVHAGWW